MLYWIPDTKTRFQKLAYVCIQVLLFDAIGLHYIQTFISSGCWIWCLILILSDWVQYFSQWYLLFNSSYFLFSSYRKSKKRRRTTYEIPYRFIFSSSLEDFTSKYIKMISSSEVISNVLKTQNRVVLLSSSQILLQAYKLLNYFSRVL